MSKIPAVAWVCLTVVFLGALGSVVYLSAVDVDTTEFYRFLNVVLNLAPSVLGTGTIVLAGRAVSQTNGNLDARIRQGVTASLAQQRAEDTGDVARG